MTGVVVVPHLERGEATSLALEVTRWLTEQGHDAWLPLEDAYAIGVPQLGREDAAASAGLAVSLGGDGTMLRTVALLDGAPVPILGVNLGQLGYLTEVEPPHTRVALSRFFAGDYRVEERMLLDVDVEHVDGRPAPPCRRALNEAAIEKRAPSHTVRMAVLIDGGPFTTYAADGIILATPTGSTAYSLSARGPIVSPYHRAILVTPVSPHSLFDRSLVLAPDERVEVVLRGHRPAELTVDGRRLTALHEGDLVRVTASTATACLVRLGEHHFHEILKAKFRLSDR